MKTLEGYLSLQDFLGKMPEEERRHERRYLARHDLYCLLRYELHRPDVGRQWILDRCREVQDNPNGYLDLWARDHYKSTCITFAMTIQDILSSHGEGPDEKWMGAQPCFGIFSHTRPIAKQFLRQIKQEFESNEDLKDLFPDVLWDAPKKQAPKWSEDEGITVRRAGSRKECTVEAWGLVDGQPTSKHFDVRIYDDVVTRESVTSAEMIEKTTQAWELSINLGTDGLGNDSGIERYIGTRYNLVDAYQTMIDRKSVKPRLHPATDDGTPDGTPVLLSEAAWEKKKRDTTPYILSCQQLLNPTPDKGAFFPMIPGVTIRYYDPTQPLPPLRKYGVTDGAVSRDEGDHTVHIVYGNDPNDDIYLLDLWREQADIHEWIDAQIDLVLQHRETRNPIIHWRGEAGGIERAAEPTRNKRMKERVCYYDHDTLPSIGDKSARASSFQGRWKMGKIFLPRGAPWVPGFILELQQFPSTTVDDQVDAAGLIGRSMDETYRAGTLKPPEKTIEYQPGKGVTVSPQFILDQVREMQSKARMTGRK